MSLETFDWKGYLQYIGYPEDQIPDNVSDEELLDIRRHWAQTVYQEELAAAQDDPFLETPKERHEYARDSLLAVAPEFRSEFGLRDPQPAERAFSAQEFHDWVVNNEYQDGNLDFYLKTFAASRINKNTKYEYPYLEGLTKKEFQDMFMEQNGIDPDLTTIEDIRNGNFGPAAMARREEEESNLPKGSAMRQGWLEFKKLTGLTTETFGDFLGVEWMRNIGRGITENAIKTIDEEGYRGKYQESLVDTVKNEGIFAGAGKVLQMAQENWATTGIPLALAGMSAMFGIASRNPRLAAQSLASARASLAAATSADVAMGTGAAATVGRVGASTIAKSLAFASAMASGLEVGAVREELEQKGKEEGRQLYDPGDPGDAVAWGLLSAALDHIGNMATFVGGGGLIRAAKGLTQAQQTRALEAASAAARQAAREAGKSWGRKIVEAMGIEGITESLQELPSVMAARNKGVEYTPKEIRDRMIDAGVVGAFMGGGMRTVQSIPETLRERARRTQSESETTQTPAAPTPPTNVPPAPNQPPPAGFDEKLAWNTNFAEIDNGNGWAAWDGYNVGYAKTKEEASQALLDQSNANKDRISGTPTSTASESRISFGNGGELVVTGNGHQGVIKRIIDLHNSNDNYISLDGTRTHTFDATALSGLNEKDFRKHISQNWGNTTLQDTRGVRQARVDQVDIGINFDAEIRDNNGNVIGRRAELDLNNYRDQLEAKGYRIIASRFSGNGNVQTVQLFRDGQLYRIELTTSGNDVTSTIISKGILGNYEGRVESGFSVQRHRVTDVGGTARVLNNVLSIAPAIRAGGVQIERDAAGTDAKFVNRKALEDFVKKQGGKIDKIGERSITYEFGGETMKLDLQANGDVLVSRNGRFLGSYQFDGSDIGNGVQRATYDLINNVTSSPRFSERDVWQEMGYARKAGGRRNVLIVYDNERNEYYIIKVSKNGNVTTAMIPRDPNGFFARLEALQNMRTIEDVRFVYGSQFRIGYVEMVTDANGIYGMRSRTTGLATDDINDVQFLTDDEIDDIINNSANPSYNPDFMRNAAKVVGVSQYVSSTTTTPARIVDWVTVDDPSQVAGFIERAKGYGAMIADYDSMGSNISELGKAWNAPGEITADAGALGLTDLYEGDYLNFEPDAYIDALEQQGTASARLSIEEDIKKVAKATRKAFQDMRDLLSRSSAYLPSITTYDIQALENSYRSVFGRRPRNITNAAIKARDIRRHFYRARLLQAKLHMEVLASDPEFYGNRIIDNTIRNTAYDPNWGNDELRLAVAEAEEFVLRLEEEFISLRDMQNSASFTRQIWDSLYPGQGVMYGSFIERIHNQGRDFRFSRDVNAGRAERNISILDELSRHPFLGQGALNDLIESGKLVILSTQQEIESALIRERGYAPHFSELGNIQGFASNDNQRVYLSEWGIKQGDAFRVLLHEFGIHAKYLGFTQAQFQEILAGIRQNATAQTPEGRWIRLAIQKVESTNMKRNNPYFWEEVAAYLVEHSNEYAGLGILDQMQAWVKRWLFTNGYIDATNFHYQDFAIFSLGMLKDSRIPFRLMNGKFDYSKHQAGIYDARKFVEDYITDDLVNELGYSREELRELMAAHLVGTYKNVHVLGDLPDEEEFASRFPGMDAAWAEYRRDRSLDDSRFSRDIETALNERINTDFVPQGMQKEAGVRYPNVADEIADIRFSRKKSRLAEYRNTLERVSDEELENSGVSRFSPEKIDEIINKLGEYKNETKEKAMLHWIISGGINIDNLTEDEYKVDTAIDMAQRRGEDLLAILSKDKKSGEHKYDFPIAYINEYLESRPEGAPIRPEQLEERFPGIFTDEKSHGDGIVSYQVQDTKEGQQAMREIINTHLGKDQSPWCLLYADAQGRLQDRAWQWWSKTYTALPKRVAFKNGNLISFMATNNENRVGMHSDIERAEDLMFSEYAYYTYIPELDNIFYNYYDEQLKSELFIQLFQEYERRGEYTGILIGVFSSTLFSKMKRFLSEKTIEKIDEFLLENQEDENAKFDWVDYWDDLADAIDKIKDEVYQNYINATIQLKEWVKNRGVKVVTLENGNKIITDFNNNPIKIDNEYYEYVEIDGYYYRKSFVLPPEKWWDINDQSHPDLDWARDPSVGRLRYSIAGPDAAARLLRTRKYERIAEEMRQAGKDAKTIKLATGYEYDEKQNVWRYEISNIKHDFISTGLEKLVEYYYNSLNNRRLEGRTLSPEEESYLRVVENLTDVSKFELNRDRYGTMASLNEIFDAPEIYKAYPNIFKRGMVSLEADYPASMASTTGRNHIHLPARLIPYLIYPNEFISDANRREMLRSNILHEIQHVIQNYEGISNTQYDPYRGYTDEEYWGDPGEIEARRVQIRRNMSKKELRQTLFFEENPDPQRLRYSIAGEIDEQEMPLPEGTIRFSHRDVAKLTYDFGNFKDISLQQFSERFQKYIEGRDKTIEDVERICADYIENVSNKPADFVPQVDPRKRNYLRYFFIENGESRGQLYDDTNAQHNYDASDQQRRVIALYRQSLGEEDFNRLYKLLSIPRNEQTKEQKDEIAVLDSRAKESGNLGRSAQEEADTINRERNKAIESLAEYFKRSSDYHSTEKALILWGAMRYAITERMVNNDELKVKLWKLSDDNDARVMVVPGEWTAKIVDHLRRGASYEDALVKASKEMKEINAAKRGVPVGFTGWKVYEQNDSYEAGQELQQAVAGTGWCTGASVNTAQMHRKGGDFHVYFENGNPTIAIRTENARMAEPPRGAHQGQFCTPEEEAIAEEYIRTGGKIAAGDDYLKDREDIRRVASGEMTWQEAFLMPDKRRYGNGEFGGDTKAWPEGVRIAINDILERHKEERLAAGWFYNSELDGSDNEKVIYLFTRGSAIINSTFINVTNIIGNAYIFEGSFLPNLTNIQGTVFIHERKAVPKLTTIEGDVNIDIEVTVPKLTTVTGYATIQNKASVPELVSIGGYADIREGANAPKLTTIGENARIYKNTNIPELMTIKGNLEIIKMSGKNVEFQKLMYIGGNLLIYEGANFPNLTVIGGAANINSNAKFPKLTTINGTAYINEGANAPELTTIGGSATIRVGANVPKLKSVGEDLEFYTRMGVTTDASSLTSVGGRAIILSSGYFPNLISIGGDAVILDHVDTSALTTVGGDFAVHNTANISSLTTIGGNIELYDGKVTIPINNIEELRRNMGVRFSIAQQPIPVEQGTAIPNAPGMYKMRDGSIQVHPEEVPLGRETEMAIYAAVVLSEPAKNDPGIVDLREMIAADEVLREQVLAELSARGIEDNPDNEFVFGIRNVLQTREPEDPTYQAIVDVFHDVITKATGGVQDDILLTDNDIAAAAHALIGDSFEPLLGEPVPTAPMPKETIFDKIEREHRMIEDRHRDIVENLIEVDENTGAVRFSIANCEVFLDGNFRDTATDRHKQEFYAELERIHGTTHQYGEADGFYNQLASAQMTGTQEVRDYGALAQPADANRALVEDFIRRLNPEIYDKIQIEWVNTPDANTNLAGGLASFNPVGRGANKLIYIQGWGRTAGQVIRSAAWEASRFGWNSGIISNLKVPLTRFYDLHESAIYQELSPYYTKYGITRGNVGDEHKVFLVQSYFAKMNQNILTGNPNALSNTIGIDPTTYKRIHDEVQNNVNTAVRDITQYIENNGSISTDPEIAKAFAQDILRIVMGGMNGRGASFVYKTNGTGVSDTIYCYTNDFGLHRKPRLPADDENRHAHVAREIKENIEWWRKTFEPFGLGELAANFCKFFLRNFPMHNGLSFLHLNVPHARLGDSTITRATNLISRIWQRVDDPHGIEIRRNIAVMEKVQAILRDHHYDARWTQNATGGYEALFRSLGITDEKSLATAKLADHALPGMLAMIRENAGAIRNEFASTIDSLMRYMESGGVPAHEIDRMSERMNAYAESFIDDYEHRSYEVYTTDGLDELVAMQHDLNIDPTTGEMGIYAKARQARRFISDTEIRLRGRNAEFYRETEEARKIVRRLERLESLRKYKEGKLLQAKSPLRGAELQEAVIKQMNDEIAARIKDIQDLKVEGRGSYKKFNYIPGSKRRKLDERLELDREYMNFLGRIEDPLMNAIYSIDQQRKIIEKLFFNRELGEHILSTGMGTISGSVVSTPVGAGTVGDLTNMENGTFLQYVNVDPIFLKEINNEYMLNSRVRDSVLGGVIDVWKANNTIYSIKLGINNYVGNFSMLLASGHLWRYANWISAGQITKRQFFERYTDNLEDMDQFAEQVYKEMRDNRVVGGTMSEMNVMTYGRGHHEKIWSMFLRHLRDAHILSNQGTFKAEEWVNNFLEKMKLTYAFGDEWVKPLMYLNNRANAIAKYESKLNPNDPRFAGDPEMWRDEVKRLAIQEAAEQTIRESVSWENSPQLIRLLSQQNLRIFTPDFLMHNFQMVRITASNFMRLGECIRELSTLEVNNERDAKYQDALIKEIAQRSVGGAMTTATYAMLMGAAGSVMALVPYMFNVLFKSIEGEDGDDEEKGMFFDPQEWEGAQRLMNYKTGGNNLFVPVFRKDNKIYAWNYVRSSVMLTHAPVMPPTENPDLVDYGVIMFRNLVDLSNGTMTQQLINNMMGRDRWGREIGTLAGWGQVIERTMVPGFARQLAGVTLGYPLTDNLYHQGRLVKIPDLLGITVNEYDPRDIANQLAFDITAHNSNGKNVARRNFMERLLKGERLDDRQIVDMINDMRAKNAEEFGKANYVLTGLRQIGMTDKELMQWLTVSRKGGGDALGRKQAADFLKGKEIYDYALVTSLINQRKNLIEEGKKTRMSEEELAVAVGNFDRAIRIYKQSLRQ